EAGSTAPTRKTILVGREGSTCLYRRKDWTPVAHCLPSEARCHRARRFRSEKTGRRCVHLRHRTLCRNNPRQGRPAQRAAQASARSCACRSSQKQRRRSPAHQAGKNELPRSVIQNDSAESAFENRRDALACMSASFLKMTNPNLMTTPWRGRLFWLLVPALLG